jgi:hypothetical protein
MKALSDWYAFRTDRDQANSDQTTRRLRGARS